MFAKVRISKQRWENIFFKYMFSRRCLNISTFSTFVRESSYIKATAGEHIWSASAELDLRSQDFDENAARFESSRENISISFRYRLGLKLSGLAEPALGKLLKKNWIKNIYFFSSKKNSAAPRFFSSKFFKKHIFSKKLKFGNFRFSKFQNFKKNQNFWNFQNFKFYIDFFNGNFSGGKCSKKSECQNVWENRSPR